MPTSDQRVTVISFGDRLKAAKGELLLGLLWLMKCLCRHRLLRERYHRIVIALLRRTDLFDREVYLAQNPDVRESGLPPLRHYVTQGDAEGRAPLPIFEPAYYRSQFSGVLKQVNTLLHYLYIGRHLRLSPGRWFDVDYYLFHNQDVRESGQDPLGHYIKSGGLEGRDPSPDFDSWFYLQHNPKVAESGINPLLHYLQAGQQQGLQPRPDQSGGYDTGATSGVSRPSLPAEEDWRCLSPRAQCRDAAVDVIVPVYKGRAETLCCLYSALAAASQTPFELVVINDASPDPELVKDLESLSERWLFTLLVNDRNRGFVQTVNRGMALHEQRDVVLLNADAEVYDGWLDRLYQTAHRDGGTATVTPLSNNATICSYPHFLCDNPSPLECTYAELDALTAEVNAGVEVEAPTGVGFCMYLTRRSLNQLGAFDAKAFGKGYGEENDFCQRALKRGYRNVIAADVFVRHRGAASFQGEKAKRVQAGLKILDKRFPKYQKHVDDFIQRDPLDAARRRLDQARLMRASGEQNVLIVCHDRGGGTERHVREDVQRFLQSGCGVFFLRPMRGDASRVVLRHPSVAHVPNLEPLPLDGTGALQNCLDLIGISEIHVHSLVDLEPTAPGRLVQLARELGAKLEVNVHDYEVICPRVNLVDGSGRYCGEPGAQQCNTCLRRNGSVFDVHDIHAWREQHGLMLDAADAVLVPDPDVATRLSRYFPAVEYQVSPHEDVESLAASSPAVRSSHGKRRIVIVGAISNIKGYNVLLACAQDAKARALPIEFILMGYSRDDRLLKEAGVRVTGRYLEQTARSRLVELAPDLVWLPSVWPETYSYTLSIALSVDVPIAAFDIGAIARRLREHGLDQHLLPLVWTAECRKVNEALLCSNMSISASSEDACIK